jgi:hypothetical protein
MRCKSFRLLSVLMLVLCSTFSFAINNPASSAAKGINKANAPVPTPLLNGKKVFISFDPSDVLAFPSVYSGGPERAYNEFFAYMKQWGHYEVVLDPKEADLVFSVRFVENHDLLWPQIRVVMTDAKTKTVLWGLVEQIDGAFFKKHRDQAFSNSVMKLVDDIQELIAPGSPQPFPVTIASGKTPMSDQ